MSGKARRHLAGREQGGKEGKGHCLPGQQSREKERIRSQVGHGQPRAKQPQTPRGTRQLHPLSPLVLRENNPGKNTKVVANWRAKNPDKSKEATHRYRTRKLNAYVAPVDFEEIYQRDNGLCKICGQLVERSKATLDHIIPLSKGGTHEPSNVQIAHGPCNSSKGAKLIQPLCKDDIDYANVNTPLALAATVSVFPSVAETSAGVESNRQ